MRRFFDEWMKTVVTLLCFLALLLQVFAQKVCRENGTIAAGKCRRFCDEIEGSNTFEFDLSAGAWNTMTLYFTDGAAQMSGRGGMRTSGFARYFEVCNRNSFQSIEAKIMFEHSRSKVLKNEYVNATFVANDEQWIIRDSYHYSDIRCSKSPVLVNSWRAKCVDTNAYSCNSTHVIWFKCDLNCQNCVESHVWKKGCSGFLRGIDLYCGNEPREEKYDYVKYYTLKKDCSEVHSKEIIRNECRILEKGRSAHAYCDPRRKTYVKKWWETNEHCAGEPSSIEEHKHNTCVPGAPLSEQYRECQ